MTRGEAILLATHHLKEAGIDAPEREARLLLSYAIRCDALELITRPATPLTFDEEQMFQIWLARRAGREPLARIHGLREFWGLPFGMNEATLEPRPDTETLVECVLKKLPDRAPPHRIADMGTGTGCVLLSLLHEYPQAKGVGVDYSERALLAARQNAVQLGVGERAEFLYSNWFEKLEGTFDIIVSNPPYIAANDIETLEPEVRRFDPRLALDGGKDGLDAYRVIVAEAGRFLKPGGFLAVEIGYQQAEAVADVFSQHGWTQIETKKDLQGIVRVVSGTPLLPVA